jgi:hypothetical protein
MGSGPAVSSSVCPCVKGNKFGRKQEKDERPFRSVAVEPHDGSFLFSQIYFRSPRALLGSTPVLLGCLLDPTVPAKISESNHLRIMAEIEKILFGQYLTFIPAGKMGVSPTAVLLFAQ